MRPNLSTAHLRQRLKKSAGQAYVGYYGPVKEATFFGKSGPYQWVELIISGVIPVGTKSSFRFHLGNGKVMTGSAVVTEIAFRHSPRGFVSKFVSLPDIVIRKQEKTQAVIPTHFQAETRVN